MGACAQGNASAAAQTRFFDYFLRDQDTGLLDEPPIRLEARENRDTVTSVRHVPCRPPPDTAWRAVYLASGPSPTHGTMREEPPGTDGLCRFKIGDGRARFRDRFPNDTELTGPMLLPLTLSVAGTWYRLRADLTNTHGLSPQKSVTADIFALNCHP